MELLDSKLLGGVGLSDWRAGGSRLPAAMQARYLTPFGALRGRAVLHPLRKETVGGERRSGAATFDCSANARRAASSTRTRPLRLGLIQADCNDFTGGACSKTSPAEWSEVARA